MIIYPQLLHYMIQQFLTRKLIFADGFRKFMKNNFPYKVAGNFLVYYYSYIIMRTLNFYKRIDFS